MRMFIVICGMLFVIGVCEKSCKTEPTKQVSAQEAVIQEDADRNYEEKAARARVSRREAQRMCKDMFDDERDSQQKDPDYVMSDLERAALHACATTDWKIAGEK